MIWWFLITPLAGSQHSPTLSVSLGGISGAGAASLTVQEGEAVGEWYDVSSS